MIRPPTGGERDQLAHVHVEAWRDAYADLLPEEIIGRMTVERRADR